jgi:small Trp-rich protein
LHFTVSAGPGRKQQVSARATHFSYASSGITLPKAPGLTLTRPLIAPMLTRKGVAMILIAAIVALSLLKYFEIWKFAAMSWGWVVALAVFAFLWFEFIEKWLGLDKRQANDEVAKRRAERIKKSFKK